MDTLENFNPLDVLATAAAWQSANVPSIQATSPEETADEHITERLEDTSQSSSSCDLQIVPTDTPPKDSVLESPESFIGKSALFLDHPYARLVGDGDDDITTDFDDVDSSARKDRDVTEADEREDEENQLFIVLDENLTQLCAKEDENSVTVSESSSAETTKCPETDTTEGELESLTRIDGSSDTTDGIQKDCTDDSSLRETNNNIKHIVTNESISVPDSVETPLKVEIDAKAESQSSGNTSAEMSPKSDVKPELKPSDELGKINLSLDQVVPRREKALELVASRVGTLKEKILSPPADPAIHNCVGVDCCSPSDISTVARDMCIDRLSSASSQDFYTEDGQESPRSIKMAYSSKMRRQPRGIYNIPLGPLLSDAQERPEHPLKDHDYCLHSFYLAMTHNRIDEPVRRPGPQPKPKKKSEKTYKHKHKKRKKDDQDMASFKDDPFSDSDSMSLDSPCKSRMSSPTNSVASSDFGRERVRTRDKRLHSLPSFLEKKETSVMSNFNDNYVFFGRKPKRRNRTMVENNHDKLKKFNHSEFLPGLDINYLEARAKFHKKVEPSITTEVPELDLTQNAEMTLPKGALAYGISEEESQFIDSLQCSEQLEHSEFHHELDHDHEITHEQVKELLTAVGVDNAMKLIESTNLEHNDQTSVHDSSLNSDLCSQPGDGSLHDSKHSMDIDLTSADGLGTEPSVADATSADKPKELFPLKAESNNEKNLDNIDIHTAIGDLTGDLNHGLRDTPMMGTPAPDLNLGNVSDLGGTTPHDLLDLDDTDLLSEHLNLNVNSILNFQSPDKTYHPGPRTEQEDKKIGLAQRKLDLDLSESFTGLEKGRGYVRNNPSTMGKPEQVLKSQMFKSLSELGQPEHHDNGVPELITVNMYWNDLPGLLINGKQYVRLVDIHKQVLPAKPTGLLKNRCRALNMEISECSEIQRDFLIRYAHAAASRSQIIVSKDVAETLIGYYVDKPPVKKADDSASVADGSTYSYRSDDIARLEDVQIKPKNNKKSKKRIECKPRGRPKGASLGSSCVNVTFKLAGEMFQKRVQTSGFSLLCESDSDESEIEQRMSAATARFQQILNLRAQIKSIRAEIYAIQKRQQRANIRKTKGIMKRKRSKYNPKLEKLLMIRDEPKRKVQTSRDAILPTMVEKSIPTVRVAPNVESATKIVQSCVLPRTSSQNVIVEPLHQISELPSAIVTPLNPRYDSMDGSMIIDTSPGSSYLDTSDLYKDYSTTDLDVSKNSELSNKSVEIVSDEVCHDVVLVREDESRRLSLPGFRCSTPSEGKPPTRLAVQHYNGANDVQNGYLYLNMFVSTKSSCIRCATCFQLMTIIEFLSHLHSADDSAKLIRHLVKPRHMTLQDEHYLSEHQQTLWQQFHHKTTSVSPVRSMKKKNSICNKKRLRQNVQLARVSKTRSAVVERKIEPDRKVIKAKPALKSVPIQADDSSRYSGRVRKSKQFSPDEGYTLPKTHDKVKKSRSEGLMKTGQVVRVSPLAGHAYGRPVCKVNPRPVAKISPVQALKSGDSRQRPRTSDR